MKIGLLQILYANLLVGLYYEDPYTHLTKFYNVVGTLGMSNNEEEAVFIQMFPHSLTNNKKSGI